MSINTVQESVHKEINLLNALRQDGSVCRTYPNNVTEVPATITPK